MKSYAIDAIKSALSADVNCVLFKESVFIESKKYFVGARSRWFL